MKVLIRILLLVTVIKAGSSRKENFVLSIFRPFNTSILYNSAYITHLNAEEKLPKSCLVVDLIGNYLLDNENERINKKLEIILNGTQSKICPFFLLRDKTLDFVVNMIDMKSAIISVPFVVNDSNYTVNELNEGPLVFLSVEEYTNNFYKKVRQKDLTYNFIDFHLYKKGSDVSMWIKLLILISIVYVIFGATLFTIYVRRFKMAKKCFKNLNKAQGQTKCWNYLIIVLFICAAGTMLLLMFFFYDIFVYLFVSLFLIEIIMSGVFFSDILGSMMVKNAEKNYLMRKRKWNLTIFKLISGFIFLAIGIVWVTIRRYNPVGPILEILLGMQILTFALSSDAQASTFKFNSLIFLYLVVYDVVMVYISPYWKLTSKITGPFASLAEVSVMESVATGQTGMSGESLPLLFRISFDYLKNDLLFGYGDVIVPGLMMANLAFYDYMWNISFPIHAIFGFAGYGVGLTVCLIVGTYMKSGQPALLFLCPFTFLIILIGTWLTNKSCKRSSEYSLKSIWNNQILTAPIMRKYSQLNKKAASVSREEIKPSIISEIEEMRTLN